MSTCSLHFQKLACIFAADVIVYNFLFGHVHLESEDFFQLNMRPSARGHKYKLCKNFCASRVRSAFFSERIVNMWNSLPMNVDFRTVTSLGVLFRLSILLHFLDVRLKRKCLNC